MALGTSTTSQSPDAGNGAVPMEIDCVKGKDKGKGKKGTRKGGKDSKGKGKTKNDGKAKDYGKCNAGGQGKGKTCQWILARFVEQGAIGAGNVFKAI